MISTVLFIPIVLGIVALLLNSKAINRIALLGSAAIYIVVGFARWQGIEWHILPDWLISYFTFDSIGLYFFSIMTLVFAASAVYSLFYFKEHDLTAKQESVYVAEVLFFVVAMTGVILATHLALMWVFVEATTLTSALLIYFEKKKSSLEATWKYVYICSIGIALAFVGIILLSVGSKGIGSLYFADLYKHATEINPFWLKISFAFIFIGFGTKIGVAPIHAWLPDAHSEAPSPVSALLSGTLLNSAFLGLLRVQEIFVSAHSENFSNFIFLLTGFLSLMVSAVFMLRIKNYKRMLAYSSIENMGILFIGITLGKVGIFAVMLHTLAHSLSKTSLFLTSGNILSIYKSKKVENVSGLLEKDSRTGWLWIISAVSILGMPPFPAFLSKFLIIKSLWTSGFVWLTIPFFLFIVVITYGMGNTVFKMVFGETLSTGNENSKLSFWAYVPQLVLLLMLLIVGTNMPQQVLAFINNATGFLVR